MTAVRILDGNTFVVADRCGDFEPSPTFPTGLLSWDTRFLSRWVLRVNDNRLYALSVDDLEYFQARFFLTPANATHGFDPELSIIRQQTISDCFEEQLTIVSHADEPLDLHIRLDAASDFADISTISQPVEKKGTYQVQVHEERLHLVYRRDDFQRETVIHCAVQHPDCPVGPRTEFDEQGLTITGRITARGTWIANLNVAMLARNGRTVRESLRGIRNPRPRLAEDLHRWMTQAPKLECEHPTLHATYRRSLVDLAALRYTPMVSGGLSVPAAGLPWSMTIFGRDSILTSIQALPFASELAAATLYALSIPQGCRLDDFRDEEPGKILHEFRYGESTAFEEHPQSPYYGAADTTPLYLILMDEYERWTGDGDLVRRFEREARAALHWISTYANLMGDNYIWYQRRNTRSGLKNQCWKDSWDGISYSDGRLPGFPRATCELQGYAYDARIRGARLAREFWNDPALADQLEKEAADLKERFNRDFWVEDGEYYALALDPDGGKVDALSSNIGHLLWSGIVDSSRADRIAQHLVGPRLFSGWGVRTLAEGEGRFNPLGYHIGTVWPFDNSFIAWGLRRYGFEEEAARIAESIIEAAGYFGGRLPEAFGGYDRKLTRYPVDYPTACSPQAWSAGTPLLLLRTMLGLEPLGEHLISDAALPGSISRIALLDIPGRWGRIDVLAVSRL
ncbi:glycogen debranching N-terminal domain-containing protein [Micromonospora sp. CPCC 206060]|uniref:amylo-alpha-1,6-glucosidase n=1 Tax=Micromonospora sp. CPCC 206060 TaxID=3122406 RepID=UPI002FEED6E5